MWRRGWCSCRQRQPLNTETFRQSLLPRMAPARFGDAGTPWPAGLLSRSASCPLGLCWAAPGQGGDLGPVWLVFSFRSTSSHLSPGRQKGVERWRQEGLPGQEGLWRAACSLAWPGSKPGQMQALLMGFGETLALLPAPRSGLCLSPCRPQQEEAMGDRGGHRDSLCSPHLLWVPIITLSIKECVGSTVAFSPLLHHHHRNKASDTGGPRRTGPSPCQLLSDRASRLSGSGRGQSGHCGGRFHPDLLYH